MTQATSYQVPSHPSGLDMRTQLNTIIAALLSDNCGPVEPTVTYPGMYWGDTTAVRLKRRTNANDGWINIGPLDDFLGDLRTSITNASNAANNRVLKAGDTMTGLLTMSNAAPINFGWQGNAGVAQLRGESSIPGCGFVNSAGTAWNVTINDNGVVSFPRQRPNWAGCTPWDTGNLNPVSKRNGNGNMGYVFTDTGNTITINWDGNYEIYVDGIYQGYLWRSGNFDPSSKANYNAGAATNNVQVEIGPLAKPNTGPLDAGSPWVLCGVRVGGWVGPSGDCVGQLFTRLTQVVQR
jgi:hypothetical protein